MFLFSRTSAFVILASAAACGAPDSPVSGDDGATERAPETSVENVAVTFNRNSGAYALEWTLSKDGGNVDILVSTSPDGSGAERIAEDISATEFTWSPGTGDAQLERRYFIIEPENGYPMLAATRVLPLEGGRNFRDLGGYETGNGRRVKWGKVYRSGVMHGLTDADYDYLSGLGIQVVCDLRTAEERRAEPTKWRAGEIDYQTFPDPEEEADANPLVQVFSDPDVTPEKVSAMMTELYSGILEQQAPAYTAMFDELANGDLPLAFNCSAGKDRAGVGAALILTALGVSRETVVADYALSEQVVDYSAEFELGSSEIDPDSPYAFLAQLSPELVEPLMRSDPTYIRSAFADIEAEHGSVIAFIQAELGVDNNELARIRNRLLTPRR